jgi:hypothetical protein
MSGFWEKRAHNALGAAAVGMASFGGGLWLADLKAAAASAAGERQAAALLLAVTLSLFLAVVPGGLGSRELLRRDAAPDVALHGRGLSGPGRGLVRGPGAGVAGLLAGGVCPGLRRELGGSRGGGAVGAEAVKVKEGGWRE